MTDPDEELVARFLEGEKGAFDDLVRRYQRPIFYLVLRYVKDDDTAREVAQRAFVKAFRGLAGLRGGGAFRAWLYRIASNLALNHMRDRARERPLEDAGVDVPVEPVGARRMAEAESHAALRAAIAELPPRQRQVLELRIFEELSFREVAEIAGGTENAAKVNFHLAVKRLRLCMEQDS